MILLDTPRLHQTIPKTPRQFAARAARKVECRLAKPLKPGTKTPESGIYRPTKGGTKVAVSKDDRLPPTKPGGGWVIETPTKKK